MRQLHASISFPWLLLGDFNKILHPDEYWDNGSRSCNQIAKLTKVVDDCLRLDDLVFSGDWLYFFV